MKELRRASLEGFASADVLLFLKEKKPVEELYDLVNDPWELRNIANDDTYSETLARLRQAHIRWTLETCDLGLIPEPELASREKLFGNRYAILHQADSQRYIMRIRDVASLAGEATEEDLAALLEYLNDQDAVIRYWAVVGLARLGEHARQAVAFIRTSLDDESAVVQVAAALALCRLGEAELSLPVLNKILLGGQQWERLHAAIALDEIGDLARPVIPQLESALADEKGFLADGKYRIRVVNHALNKLLGTANVVP